MSWQEFVLTALAVVGVFALSFWGLSKFQKELIAILESWADRQKDRTALNTAAYDIWRSGFTAGRAERRQAFKDSATIQCNCLGNDDYTGCVAGCRTKAATND